MQFKKLCCYSKHRLAAPKQVIQTLQRFSNINDNMDFVSEGWLDETDRKTSLTSLAQDQTKFGSKTALNRRVKATF